MNQMQKKKLSNNIIFITLIIYMFFSNVANYTIYSNISILILLGVSFFYIINQKKVCLNLYFLLYIVFMLYQLILVLTGVAVSQAVTISTLQTMLINLIILFCIYNIIIYTKDMKGFMKAYIVASTLSLAFIMFILRDNLFSGRLAHAWGEDAVSYYFLGKPIAMSSNGLAFFCTVSTLFSIYLYKLEKNKLYIVLSLFFVLGTVLTGSRKGILLLCLYIAFVIHISFKNKTGLKILVGGIVIGGVYLLITRVPVFYDIIGERLLELVNLFLGQDTSEGSIMARERFKSYALEWIGERPWMGYGAGAFKAVYENVTESNYLEMLVSGGAIGLILYYLYTIPVIKQFMQMKQRDNILKILFFIVISILIVEYGSVSYLARNYLMFIVIYLAYVKIVKKNKESRDESGRDN